MSTNKEKLLQQPHHLPISESPILQPQYVEGFNLFPLPFTPFPLLLICPILIWLHLSACSYLQVPILQYLFVSTLTAFLLNYFLIIRAYNIYPYLPKFDIQLKKTCVSGTIALLCSTLIGWNGSGGILFAMWWEHTRGRRPDTSLWFLLCIIVGSLLLQNNYSWTKAIEFIPGLLLGYSNSKIYTLKTSSEHTVAHQFLFLCAVVMPAFFPWTTLVVPTLTQWGCMLAMGVLMLGTIILLIKLMQSIRVSITMTVLSGLIIVATSSYTITRDYVGAALVIVGIPLLLRREIKEIDA